MFRTTTVIDAPARVVAAALTETATLRGVFADAGVRLRAAEVVLAPGDEPRAGPLRVRMAEASVTRMRLITVSGPALSLTAELAETATGTLLTSTVDGARWTGRWASALAEGLAVRAGSRAEELRGAAIVVATAIVRERRILVQQRGFPAETAGRWELPGGRVEPGEPEPDAVRRECVEELGVTVAPGALLGPDVVLAGGKYLLRTYSAEVTGGEPHPREHLAVRWLRAGQLGSVDWLPADRVLLPVLRAHLEKR